MQRVSLSEHIQYEVAEVPNMLVLNRLWPHFGFEFKHLWMPGIISGEPPSTRVAGADEEGENSSLQNLARILVFIYLNVV